MRDPTVRIQRLLDEADQSRTQEDLMTQVYRDTLWIIAHDNCSGYTPAALARLALRLPRCQCRSKTPQIWRSKVPHSQRGTSPQVVEASWRVRRFCLGERFSS